jgi:beta-lactamase class D
MSLSSPLLSLRIWVLTLAASLITITSTTAQAGPSPGASRKTPAAQAKTAAPAVEHPGCFLLMELKTGQVTRVHPEQCSQPLPPASTFKVPHALIALETGALPNPEEVRAWDGTKHSIESWNQNQTLDTAMRRSAVWFFQGTARQIGRQRMDHWLKRLRYGNADTSGDITRFWLNGTLRITPEEQLDFMARLYRDELPMSARSMDTVKRTLVHGPDTVANTRSGISLYGPWKDGAVLSAKTGFSQLDSEGDVTWLIGHVKTPRGEYVFVSSVTSPGRQPEPPPALVSALSALKALNVL